MEKSSSWEINNTEKKLIIYFIQFYKICWYRSIIKCPKSVLKKLLKKIAEQMDICLACGLVQVKCDISIVDICKQSFYIKKKNSN